MKSPDGLEWTRFAAALACLLVAGAADAVEFGYDHVEGRFIVDDARGAGHGQGYLAAGSLAVARSVFVAARYRDTDQDSGERTGLRRALGGAGLRFAFTPTVDFTGFGGLLHDDTGLPGGGARGGFGAFLAGGSRAELSPGLELAMRIEYVQVFGEDETSLASDVVYRLMPGVSLVAGAEISARERSASAGLRFGN